MLSGCRPTGTVAGFCSQPEVTSALQVAPLNTETVLSPVSATYTVPVVWSMAIMLGSFPTLIVGHGPRQPETSGAWQSFWGLRVLQRNNKGITGKNWMQKREVPGRGELHRHGGEGRHHAVHLKAQVPVS